jgi:hypothetical protein
MAGVSVDPNRRARIQALVERGATEGERAAARTALARLEAAAHARTAELERSVGFGWNPSHAENDRMQRGGNYDDAA